MKWIYISNTFHVIQGQLLQVNIFLKVYTENSTSNMYKKVTIQKGNV
jgi:hypothetical protein